MLEHDSGHTWCEKSVIEQDSDVIGPKGGIL